MRIVYSRSSTATQSLLRQRHILTEAGLLVRTEGVAEGFRPADGVLLFEDPATSSKIPALERPAFAKVAAAAHPGDVLTVSELFRLCRDLIDTKAATAAGHPRWPAPGLRKCGRRSPTTASRSRPSPAHME
ncbi:recombinase family protein [Nonomuraea sp. NPDC046570]|uniref:recombinase family protein n=1 Tax=Nonomuraea sp. NPDC046570 TaxID=3155255 RepID=UPI0033E43466